MTNLQKVSRSLGALLLAFAQAGCSPQSQCGAGTEAKLDPTTGITTCTESGVAQMPVPCDSATAMVQGGICVGDPSKFPTCGDGTKLDPTSNTCIPTGMSGGCPLPPPCPHMAGKFSIRGQITHLKDGSCADKEMVEVRVYDPLKFLGDPKNTQPLEVQVTGTSTFCFTDLTDTSGMGLAALAITDPGGPSQWVLAGVGQNMVGPNQEFRTDAFIVEASLVAGWDTSAGLAPGSLEADGVYFARFIDKPLSDETGAMGVSGVELMKGGAPVATMGAHRGYYLKGDMATVDATATMTDGTGAVLQDVILGDLTTYSGMGGMINSMPVKWESFPGASTPGVVFIQKFHSM